LGNSRNAPEVKLDLPIAPGPFEPTWASIEKNYPGTPDWLRDAKFGIWVHFGPQSAGQSGDWYARKLYTPGMTANTNHVKNFGHPSEVGYKEVLRDWNPTKLDPAKLVETYKAAGARYLIIQGVHHDQFDLWDSQYQPWNAKKLGPKRDLLGEWSKAARAQDIRFGITFHHEYSWWWWQSAFMSDKTGPKAGVQYDGRLTLADGKGQWWEGLDPRLLYGIDLREYQGVESAAVSGWSPPPAGIFTRHTDYAKWYATWWALRIMDAVDKYDPDFIYTDGTSNQPFSGSGTGTGMKSDAMQRVMADFYNRTLERRGKVDVFSIVKFRPKTNGTVNTQETGLPQQIKIDQPWIGEAPVGDWFYRPGFVYSSTAVIRYILETVSRDGNAAVCISLRPDGSLDDGSTKLLKEVGDWMNINGSAIYGSHAWSIPGEGQTDNQGRLLMIPGGTIGNNQARVAFTTKDFRFTVGKNGKLNAICLAVPKPGDTLSINALGTDAKRLDAPIKSIRLLGGDNNKPLVWKQDATALSITCPEAMPFATAITFEIE
jgi:alpha-L-fucosidase